MSGAGIAILKASSVAKGNYDPPPPLHEASDDVLIRILSCN